ncbi:hypothetical protein SAMN02787142_4370 [Burkholderia sp. WP9]|jgi:hypothetical protein|nr:hypothetical protein SAMN02787142_4370 [Burkholderia sp. WP9]
MVASLRIVVGSSGGSRGLRERPNEQSDARVVLLKQASKLVARFFYV